MTRRVLADDVGAREAVAELAGMRSVVDVSISIWDEDAERPALGELIAQAVARQRTPGKGTAGNPSRRT